jgi:hypothetical protein
MTIGETHLETTPFVAAKSDFGKFALQQIVVSETPFSQELSSSLLGKVCHHQLTNLAAI